MDGDDVVNEVATGQQGDGGGRTPPGGRGGRWGSWWRRNTTNTLATGVIVAVVGAVVTPIAAGVWDKASEHEPPKCPGAGCEGKNPGVCVAGAVTFEPTRNNPARLQVRYSHRCGSAWARIEHGEAGDQVTIEVAGGGSNWGLITYGFDQFTKMVRVPRSAAVKVCALPTDRTDRSAHWDFYCIHTTGAALEELSQSGSGTG